MQKHAKLLHNMKIMSSGRRVNLICGVKKPHKVQYWHKLLRNCKGLLVYLLILQSMQKNENNRFA